MTTQSKNPYEKPELEPVSIFGAETTTAVEPATRRVAARHA